MMKKIFNVPASCAFVDEVAKRFLADYAENPLELADVLFLLPNRRACQSLKEAFVRAQGLSPTLLPQMMPIGDVAEDELIFSSLDTAETLSLVLPAVSKYYRLFWFTKKIVKESGKFGLESFSVSQACALADELCSLLDKVTYEELSFVNLQSLVPEEYASHWQQTVDFLSVITQKWPAYLSQAGVIDAASRHIKLLEIQTEVWKKSNTAKRIVVAATTATFPFMRRLVKDVLELKNGEVILSGLDKFLDDESYAQIDETHPQFELKRLLDYLKISRFEVRDFCSSKNVEREKLAAEIMRPAKETHKWRDIKARNISSSALDGVEVLKCADIRQEALAIALMMRQSLETPEKTAALVTTDRNLARRVATELLRWDIKVDDSAGKPLYLLPVGCFLRLIIQACQSERAVDVLSLMKHPYFALGESYALIRRKVRDYEKLVLRSKTDDAAAEVLNVYNSLQEIIAPLTALLSQESVDFKTLLECHIRVAEELAKTDIKVGAAVLWRGEDGEAAAQFLADLFEYADMLDNIKGEEYLGLLEFLMAQVTVRPKYGTHPRLKILGPIEARLPHFDLMIIGEVNEGAWPKALSSDPWMSRPMKKDFGLPLPEKDVGVLALDFCGLFCAKEVVLARAARVESTPMVASRWWLRLKTVLTAMGYKGLKSVGNPYFSQTALFLEKPKKFQPLPPPNPMPDVDKRPRSLSASNIEDLMRDPYIIFAKKILKLFPLEDLDRELNSADYGNITHLVLQRFNDMYPAKLPPNAREILLQLGEQVFLEKGIETETKAFWWPNFVKSIDWVLKQEEICRPDIKKVHNEIKGSYHFLSTAGDFEVTAKADRVEETLDGGIGIVDYKTGSVRSKKEMLSGYAPQLPIEGLIAQLGGFPDIPSKNVTKLAYWKLGEREVCLGEVDTPKALQTTFDNIRVLVEEFDKKSTPYYCQPNPDYAPKYSDYLQLARVAEWRVTENNSQAQKNDEKIRSGNG